MATLDQISFSQRIAIENGRVNKSEFEPIDPPPPGAGHIHQPEPVSAGASTQLRKVLISLSTSHLKTKLEQVTPSGKPHFALFRSALLSTSPVEQFMHLYNLMLMFFHDDEPGAQVRLDKFIIKENLHVEVKPYFRPAKKGKQKVIPETVYTRLRNEFGHSRPNVNIEKTKIGMAERLSELRELAKKAIQSFP